MTTVTGMPIPALAVTARDGAPCVVDAPSERDGGPRGDAAEAFLDQGPARLNRIEVGRVGRQELHCGPALLNEPSDVAMAMRPQIVHHDDVIAAQVRHQVAADPPDKPLGVGRLPHGPHGDPARRADRPDHGQRRAPVDRSRRDPFLAARHPGVGAAHREIRAGFIEKHQAGGVYRRRPGSELGAVATDGGAILFERPWAFFLKT